jgi:hypothetical protein
VTSYADLVLRYFVAQGVVGGHALVCVGADGSVPFQPEGENKEKKEEDDSDARSKFGSLVGNLMAAVGVEEVEKDEPEKDKDGSGGFGGGRSLGALRDGGASADDRMKIAWRYQSLPKLGSAGVTAQMVAAKGKLLSHGSAKLETTKPFLLFHAFLISVHGASPQVTVPTATYSTLQNRCLFRS